jgi:amidase
VADGANALLRSNGMGHHWEGLYNLGLIETTGRARRAQANDLPPTVKMVLLIGSYVAERYHGRLYAKAQNLRRVLRATTTLYRMWTYWRCPRHQ